MAESSVYSESRNFEKLCLRLHKLSVKLFEVWPYQAIFWRILLMSTLAKPANPAPLGLLGFGMTTVLLNLHNAGIIELSIMIVAMGVALGGLA